MLKDIITDKVLQEVRDIKEINSQPGKDKFGLPKEKLYDVEVELIKAGVEVRPLNEVSRQWTSLVLLKPLGLSRRTDIKSVIMPLNNLEKLLRKLMNSGFQVNFVRK